MNVIVFVVNNGPLFLHYSNLSYALFFVKYGSHFRGQQ